MNRTVNEIWIDLGKSMDEKMEEFVADRKYIEGPITKDDEYLYAIAGVMYAVAVELEKLQR